jgi:ankyrin repeat protein
VALSVSLSIIPFAILPIMVTAASILTISFAYLWIIGAALIDAIIDGSITGTKRFIALGADVNDTDSNGHTPLHCAILFSHTEIVLALIANGANVNAANQHGRTPLKSAIINNLSEIVQALIAAGAGVNTADQHGKTPLHWAAWHDNTQIAVALIAAGADVDAADQHGHTPLQWALIFNKDETARAIEHPLHWAACLSDIRTIKALIDKGYDLQAKLDDKTPLEHAIAADNLNVAKYLIAPTKLSFADLNMPNNDNSTTRFLKLAKSEPDASAASALTVAGNEIQNEVATKLSSMVQSTVDIHNSKIDFAKALFGIPTTDKAKAMVKFMMFNLTFKMKGSYRDAILTANDLVKIGKTYKGAQRPSLPTDVIGIILNFARPMPEKTNINAIAQPYYKAITSRQMTPAEMEAKYSAVQNDSTTESNHGSPAAAA